MPLLASCNPAPDTTQTSVAQHTSAVSTASVNAGSTAAQENSAVPEAASDEPTNGTSTSAAAAAAPSTGGETTATTPGSTASARPAGSLVQVAGITDGDTIKVWINGVRQPVRLLGVDTPESRKPNTAVACFAKEATSRMQSLVQSKQVHLVADPTQVDRDRYHRLVRYVVLPDGTDVSQAMIAGGFGREYTYAAAYGKQDTFRTAQTQAKSAKLGLWGACSYDAAFNPASAVPSATAPAPFVPPSTSTQPPAPRPTARPTARPTTPPPAAEPAGCSIKGNINSEGEKIYHLPGQSAYDKTKITTSKGERWFCSEQEARDAGWRRAKR